MHSLKTITWLLLPFFFFNTLFGADTLALFPSIYSENRNIDAGFKAELREVLIEELSKNNNKFSVSEEKIILPSDEGEQDKARLEELGNIKKLFAEAKTLYDSANFDQAFNVLSTIKEKLYKLIDLLKTNTTILSLHLFLGMVHLAQKEDDKAKEEFTRLAVLDPFYAIDKDEYPPNVVKSFNEAKQAVQKSEMVDIKFITNVSDPALYFNGKKAKSEINKVPAGEHFISIFKKGYETYTGKIVVNSTTDTFRFKLKKADSDSVKKIFRAEEKSAIEADKITQLQKVASSNGVQLILLSEIVPINEDSYLLILQFFDSRINEFSEIRKKKIKNNNPGQIKKLIKNISSCIDGDGFVLATCQGDNAAVGNKGNSTSSGGDGSEDDDAWMDYKEDSGQKNIKGYFKTSDDEFSDIHIIKEKPIYQKWWFVSAVTLALISTGLGVYFLLFNNKSEASCDPKDPACKPTGVPKTGQIRILFP